MLVSILSRSPSLSLLNSKLNDLREMQNLILGQKWKSLVILAHRECDTSAFTVNAYRGRHVYMHLLQIMCRK